MTIDTNTRKVDVPVYLVGAPRYMFAVRRDKADHDMAPMYVRLRDYRAALDEIDRLRAAPPSPGKGDYHEGIEEGWKAGAAQERTIWTRAIEAYFDATAVMDVEKYAEEIRKGVEGE